MPASFASDSFDFRSPDFGAAFLAASLSSRSFSSRSFCFLALTRQGGPWLSSAKSRANQPGDWSVCPLGPESLTESLVGPSARMHVPQANTPSKTNVGVLNVRMVFSPKPYNFEPFLRAEENLS